MGAKVSIVMPIYNAEPFLEDSIGSVINQTLHEIEIICVNDGSTDNSLQILEHYKKNDSRIKIISKPNSGYGHTMNVGMEQATGKYIGIVEPDDFVALDMFENLYNTAEKYNVDFVKSNLYKFKIDEYGSVKDTFINNNIITDQVIIPSEHPEVILQQLAATWTGIYNRKFLWKYGIKHNETPGASYQDLGFLFHTFMFAQRIYYVKDAYYYYRVDNPNSSINNKAKVYCVKEEYDYILNSLKNNRLLNIDKNAFMPYYWRRRFINYMATYARIDNKYKREYILHFSELFREAKKSNEINMYIFPVGDQDVLNQIINDPKHFDRGWKVRRKKEQYAKEHNGKKINIFLRAFWILRDYGLKAAIYNTTVKIKNFFKPRHFSYFDAPVAHLLIIGRKILKALHLQGLSKGMKNLEGLKNKHLNERCFIVCTGPSLSITDLDKLKNEYTIGVNSIFLAFDQTEWRPTYYAAVDAYIYDRYNNAYNMDYNSFCQRDCFLNYYIPVKETEKIHKIPISYKNHTLRRLKSRNFYAGEDISVCIHDNFTVTNMAVNLAVYMGFKDIYIIGADCNFESDKMHFIPNPFDSKGSHKGRLSNEVDLSISGYKTLKAFAEYRGINVYNATRGGHLDVFERVDFDSLFLDKPKFDKLDSVMQAIAPNVNGREIILWGKSAPLQTKVKETYGYIPKVAVMNAEVAEEQNVIHLPKLKGKNSKYYIVGFHTTASSGLVNKMRQLGYENEKDCWFGEHIPTAVSQADYTDSYGNKAHNCPKNCTVKFAGYNAEVVFEDNCQVRSDLQITVKNNAYVHIKKNSILSGIISCGDNAEFYSGAGCSYGRNSMILIGTNGKLTIFDDLKSGSDLKINCDSDSKIYIGRDCNFKSSVEISTGRYVNPKLGVGEKKRIYIGSHVRLNSSVSLLDGADIGYGSIVESGSTVNSTIANNCRIAGVFGKSVQDNAIWYDETVSSAENLPSEFIRLTEQLVQKKYIK